MHSFVHPFLEEEEEMDGPSLCEQFYHASSWREKGSLSLPPKVSAYSAFPLQKWSCSMSKSYRVIRNWLRKIVPFCPFFHSHGKVVVGEEEEEEEEHTEKRGKGVVAGTRTVREIKAAESSFESGCKVHWGPDHTGQGSRESKKGGGSASLHIGSSLDNSMPDFLFVLECRAFFDFLFVLLEGSEWVSEWVSEWNDETDPLSKVGARDSQSAGSTKGKGFC
jgi:hypothetical protein